MKKVMIITNFIAFIFFFTILAEITRSPEAKITGFATITPPPQVTFQPHIILAFIVLLATLILNTYFFTKGRNSLIKIKK